MKDKPIENNDNRKDDIDNLVKRCSVELCTIRAYYLSKLITIYDISEDEAIERLFETESKYLKDNFDSLMFAANMLITWEKTK